MINSPLKLKLEATSPPRCTIKPSGTTISITASVTITLAPPMLPEVELSKMIMVWTPGPGYLGFGEKWAVDLSCLKHPHALSFRKAVSVLS